MINKEEILNLTYEEFINYLKELTREDQLNLLKDKEILNKVFVLDEKEKDIWKFEKILEVYTFNDLYSYIDSNLIKRIKNKYKNNQYAHLDCFMAKNKDQFMENILNNKDLLSFFIEQSKWFYFDFDFDYEFVYKLFKYIEENSFDYRELFTKSIIEFKNNFLNQNIEIPYKKELLLIISNIVQDIINTKKTFNDIADIKSFIINLWNTNLDLLIKEKKITKLTLKDENFLNYQKLFLNELISFLTNIDNKLLNIKNNSLEYSESFIFSVASISLKDKEKQKKILKEDLSNRTKRVLLRGFSRNVIEDYIKNNIIPLNNNDISRYLYSYGLDLNPSEYENKEFFIQSVLSIDLTKMRDNLERIEQNNNASYFYKIKDKMLSNIISLYDSNTKTLSYYNQNNPKDSKEPYEIFLNKYKLAFPDKNNQDLTRKILANIIIDKLFKDNIKNVCMNISEILSYNTSLEKSLLDKEKIDFYQTILNLFDLNSDSLLEIYFKYKDQDVVSNFYDDINRLKKNAYQEIKESCIKIDEIKDLKNNLLSSQYNVDVYEYNGEKFKALVSCLNSVQVDLNIFERNCYSLISDKNMNVFLENEIIFGYSDFDIDKILHVYEADAYSNEVVKTGGSQFINRIRKPDILLSSNLMNEIQIVNDYKGMNDDSKMYQRISPSYVVCFDEIDERSLKAAKILNIPIIKINKQMYKNEVVEEHYLEGGEKESYYVPPYVENDLEDVFRGRSL